MIAVARIVGRENFGEVGILQSTVTMFQAFAGVGLGLTATKHVAEYRAASPERAGHIIAISDLVAVASGAIASAAVFFCAPWLAANALVRPEIAPLLRIASLTIGLSALTGAMNGTLAGMEEFRSIAKVNFISGVAAFPLLLTGALWQGVRGVVLALAAQALLTCVMLALAARSKARQHGIPIRLRGAREWPVLWRYSLPALLSGIVITPTEWLCNSLLVRHGGGYSEMGIYTAALQWRSLLMFLPIMVVQSAVPVFASVKSAHGPGSEEFRRLAVVTQNAVVLLVFPVATLLMFFAHGIFRLYGSGYAGGSDILVMTGFLVMMHCAGVGFAPAIEAWGELWAPAFFNLCWAAIYVTLVWSFVGKLGGRALPLGAGAAFLVLLYVNLWYFRGRLPVSARITWTVLGAIAALALCLATPVPARAWIALPCSIAMLLAALAWFSDRELIVRPLLRSGAALGEHWRVL
jgi:O-antigen/teichoic acid export membrane protein